MPTSHYPPPLIRPLRPDEWSAVAALICESTNAWYMAHGKPAIFTGPIEATLLFPQVYETLDPGCCLVAVEPNGGALLGSCFYHPRETHVALGIMNVAPAAFGSGIAGKLLRAITDIADSRGLHVRLVSSAQNLDSYSLYTRQGFTPRALFQDMLLPVPEHGLPPRAAPPGLLLRPAATDDIPAIVELESELVGIVREKDYRYFLANALGCWQISVATDAAGKLAGFLAAVNHPGSCLLGPGVQRDEATALALIYYALNRQRNWSPVFLIPAAAGNLVSELYALGAKNLELHVLQVRGSCPAIGGIIMPTFMPETG